MPCCRLAPLTLWTFGQPPHKTEALLRGVPGWALVRRACAHKATSRRRLGFAPPKSRIFGARSRGVRQRKSDHGLQRDTGCKKDRMAARRSCLERSAGGARQVSRAGVARQVQSSAFRPHRFADLRTQGCIFRFMSSTGNDFCAKGSRGSWWKTPKSVGRRQSCSSSGSQACRTYPR